MYEHRLRQLFLARQLVADQTLFKLGGSEFIYEVPHTNNSQLLLSPFIRAIFDRDDAW
jgi:hypothetical protein